jgi:hypothetical protein
MPWINTIRTLYLAFYSKHTYIRAAREWKGVGYGYLFVMIFLSTMCIGIWVHTWTNVAIGQIEKLILPQLPTMTFKEGHLTIDKELPYVIAVSGKNIVRFDKTDVQPDDPADFAPLIVGETGCAHYVRGHGLVREWIYKKIFSAIIEPFGIAKYIAFLKTWFGLIVTAVLLPIHFGFVATQTLLLGLIGRVFTGTMNFILSYSKLVRISVVAVTPGVVLGTILIVTNQFFPLWLGIYSVMAAVYLFYGVYSNKHADDHIFAGMPMDEGYPETTEFDADTY